MQQYIVDLEDYTAAGAPSGNHTQVGCDTVQQLAQMVKKYRAETQMDSNGNPTPLKKYKVTPCATQAVALTDEQYAVLLAVHGIR